METRFLLPTGFKVAGWILLAAAIVLYLWVNFIGDIHFLSEARIFCIYHSDLPFTGDHTGTRFFKWRVTDITPDVVGILAIAGCLFVAFSRLKVEDEYIAKIRLESLVWATIVNFVLLAVAIITIWGSEFFVVMEYNMVTTLILFVIRFHYVLYQSRKPTGYEK